MLYEVITGGLPHPPDGMLLPGIVQGAAGSGHLGPQGRGGIEPGMAQQPQDGGLVALARRRIVVEIPQQHKGLPRCQTAAATRIVHQPGSVIQVVLPQADLVGIAQPVAPLGAVKLV